MLQKIKSFIKNEKNVQWVLFILFSLLLFVKCALFHWDAFHSILISSLWREPISFYKFYMAKLLMPLFISSFIFISKHYWWTIIMSLLVDIWCISNLIYFKTYDAFLSVYDILLVGNMEGAWSSITAYFNGAMLFMFLLTILWLLICLVFRKVNLKKNSRAFIFSLFMIFILTFVNNYFIHNPKFWTGIPKEEAILLAEEENEWISFLNAHGGDEQQYDSPLMYIPFYQIYISSKSVYTPTINTEARKQYVRRQSIMSYFVAMIIHEIFNNSFTGEIVPLTENDIGKIQAFCQKDATGFSPKNNLIVILVESLEDWPLHNDVENQIIAPYLQKLKQQDHVLYCSKVKNQTLGGNSGDGQMIVNSGLLPIQDGVACMHYGNNKYPNFAHFYENSILINPWPKIWNQDTMSVRYSYKQKIEPEIGQWQDEQVLRVLMDKLKDNLKPSCFFAITSSTHAPFNRIRNSKITTNAPAILNRYMQCLNYTDSCIGTFMDYILNDPKLAQSTIVITSDHTIFKPAMLPDFMDYAKEQNLSIVSGENFCPLIIYSPQIKGNIQIDELCYQMDIFPTILHLIGCEDYYWKGFGVNLLDSVARNNRPISEQEAFILSDKVIRANWFETFQAN